MSSRVLHPQYGGLFAIESSSPLPFVLPGELVETTLQTILEASPDRVAPRCVHFGVCGGCHYQHVNDLRQLALKHAILNDVLTQQGLTSLPEPQTHSAEPWEYRNRIRLRVERDPEGVLAVGYSRPGTNEFLPIRMCPIAAPLLWRSAEALLQIAATEPSASRFLASVSEVEFFTDAATTRLQAQFFLRDVDVVRVSPVPFVAFCERLRTSIPELTGAGASLDPELNRRTRRQWAGATWGADGLAYEADGRSYWVARGAFFQVNRHLIDRLVRLATDDTTGVLAWDLFAGVGLFTRALVERFTRVVAVEGAEAASLALAGATAKLPVDTVRSSTLDFLRARHLQRERPDLVVVDPPRAGLGPEAASLLASVGAPALVYVSCDPVTLARDLAILTRSVYRIDAIDLIDLFPQTFHIETVVHLSRR